jgi:hypothetical protein
MQPLIDVLAYVLEFHVLIVQIILTRKCLNKTAREVTLAFDGPGGGDLDSRS